MLDKTLQDRRFFLANQKLKMPIALKRTMYLKHLDLAYSQPELSLPDQQLRLHYLAHTKLEFDVPTTTDAKYTSRACCRPNQNNVVLIL